MKNLLYLSRCAFGGWPTFTVHLSKKFNYPIHKITKRSEAKARDFGYECKYLNCHIDKIKKLDNLLITAIDKHYFKFLPHIPDGTDIVIHDPTEVRGTSKAILRDHLKRFNIITIRKTVQDYISHHFGLHSSFKYHPFYEYPITNCYEKKGGISISRIDYDKNIHMIVSANDIINDPHNNIEIYGAPNDLYVYFKLKKSNYNQYYCGRFGKSFRSLDGLLFDKKFLVDMSTIKNDGGGSQYTFLEAIHNRCILVINKGWLKRESHLIPGINCIAVENEHELAHIIKENDDLSFIVDNALDLLKFHTKEKW